MHVFGWWEEAGVPGENPHIHRENMSNSVRDQTTDLLMNGKPHKLMRHSSPINQMNKVQSRINVYISVPLLSTRIMQNEVHAGLMLTSSIFSETPLQRCQQSLLFRIL